MKKQKNELKHQSKIDSDHHGKRIWKIIAIAVIAIFALIIAGGLIKAHYIRSSFVKPTQAQIDYAAKIATEKLQSSGGNSSMFQIQVGRKMRRLHEDGINMTIIQVSFNNKVTSHTYLIDVNSGKVLLHSQTDMYIAFGEHQKKSRYGDHKFFGYDKIK